MTIIPHKLGLSLSGGGYRASAFHLGTLNKLHELGVLSQVDVLSTISGGSITGAAWCLYKGKYEDFHSMMIEKIQTKSVVRYILGSAVFIFAAIIVLGILAAAIWLTFTRWAPWAFVVLAGLVFILAKWQFRIFPVSRVIEKAYDNFYFDNKKLGELNLRPIIAIGSSNLHTGRPFTFSRGKMSDSTYTFNNNPVFFKHELFPVSRAVMASSCVPFAFTPITIDRAFYRLPGDYDRIWPQLVDGGVYDNQGIQKITQPQSSYECNAIITSDAGSQFLADKKYPNTIALLIRTVDLFMSRIKRVQMIQHIYRNKEGAGKPIAYLSLGWGIENLVPGFVENMISGNVLPEVIKAHGFDPVWVANPAGYVDQITAFLKHNIGYTAVEARNLSAEQLEMAVNTPTGLSCLSSERVRYLIAHAENLTELQVKLYLPFLLPTK